MVSGDSDFVKKISQFSHIFSHERNWQKNSGAILKNFNSWIIKFTVFKEEHLESCQNWCFGQFYHSKTVLKKYSSLFEVRLRENLRELRDFFSQNPNLELLEVLYIDCDIFAMLLEEVERQTSVPESLLPPDPKNKIKK
jgi:hypothetical protein